MTIEYIKNEEGEIIEKVTEPEKTTETVISVEEKRAFLKSEIERADKGIIEGNKAVANGQAIIATYTELKELRTNQLTALNEVSPEPEQEETVEENQTE